MKALRIAALILSVAAGSAAMPSSPAQDATGVTVTKLSWNKYESRTWDRQDFSGGTPEASDTAGAPKDQPSNPRQPVAGQNDLENKSARSNQQPRNRSPRVSGLSLPRVFEGYQYHATFKNTGTKTVKSITWNYIFTDPNTGKEAGRHTFISEKKIRPGKEVDLAEVSRRAPTLVVSADKDFTQRAVIDRIEFTDGSVWNRPAEEPSKDGPAKDN
ncbi:MAG TPA: hypothetical protein VE262_04090 [Blastocatellia bacterium]|nr:hypothetical protein [Blastocatellia bacterium]